MEGGEMEKVSSFLSFLWNSLTFNARRRWSEVGWHEKWKILVQIMIHWNLIMIMQRSLKRKKHVLKGMEAMILRIFLKIWFNSQILCTKFFLRLSKNFTKLLNFSQIINNFHSWHSFPLLCIYSFFDVVCTPLHSGEQEASTLSCNHRAIFVPIMIKSFRLSWRWVTRKIAIVVLPIKEKILILFFFVFFFLLFASNQSFCQYYQQQKKYKKKTIYL